MTSPHRAPFVLLVDDDSDSREVYSLTFAWAGYSVAEAANAEQAIRRATTLQPAIIIADLRLGTGPDGIELCEQLKADQRTREIPVILLTGWSHPDVPARAKRAGCIAVHLKPVAPDTLVNIVNAALQPRVVPASGQ